MKGKLSGTGTLLLKQCSKEPVNRNDRFWVDLVESLRSSLRSPDRSISLSSWIKEALSILEEPGKINITLVMPKDGCWGIYIKDKEHYLFSFNDEKSNVYISRRLYEYLKEKGKKEQAAAIILHEITEFSMAKRAKKKLREPFMNKIHGEAVRIEKEFLGKGESLEDIFEDLIGLEKDRKNVSIDSQDVYIEGCAASGEEIIAEINTVNFPRESFIAELTPGEKKRIDYRGGTFTVCAKSFELPFQLEEIDFKNYCYLMKIIDDLFIEESILEGTFKDLLIYIRNLNHLEGYDNCLLKLLWVFIQKFWTENKINKRDILYNLYIIVDEYVSYYKMLEIVRNKYWAKSKYIKNNIKQIINELYDAKEIVLETKKDNTDKVRNWLVKWFSEIREVPCFSEIQKWTELEKMPKAFEKNYKKGKSYKLEKDIIKELSAHRDILQIMRGIENFKYEYRNYNGVERQGDSKVCELLSIRTHFRKEERLFYRGEKVSVYSKNMKRAGIVEVLDLTDSSMIVSLERHNDVIPNNGFVRKLEEQDESISVQVEAIENVVKGKGIIEDILKVKMFKKEYKKAEEIDFYNTAVGEDISQKEAVSKALRSEMVTLIQGPPGTGKTTVISEIVLQHLRLEKRILLCSQTHNAVDNALENIMKYKIQDIGIGRVASREEKIVDTKIREVWIKNKNELDRFERNFTKGLVIGSTNVGSHTLSLMREREFDVLVMDEAGKANIVESILPMLLLKSSGKLIIVGDHKQGMPFEYDEGVINLFMKKYNIENLKMKERLNQSLFERLIEEGLNSIMLKVNYRSEPQIVELVSKLFYQDEVIPAKTVLRKSKSIIVVDTSKFVSIEERKETEEVRGKGYRNIYEAKLVLKEIKELVKYRYIATGIRSRYVKGVTILTPYLSQVDQIRKELAGGLKGFLSSLGINSLLDNTTTVDSFQGREDDVIIISFTRSNKDPEKVGFLSELNRINVALSRAKRKMILIGDFDTLRNAKHGLKTKATRNIFRTIYKYG